MIFSYHIKVQNSLIHYNKRAIEIKSVSVVIGVSLG